jgi:hypothetical protein
MMAGTLAGLAHVLVSMGKRSSNVPVSQKGTMSRLIDPNDPRMPIWDFPQLLEMAAAAGRIVRVRNVAVALTPADSPFAKAITNYHSLLLGPQGRLLDEAAYIFDAVANQFDFDRYSTWARQRSWFSDLFRAFYPVGEQAIGFITVTPMRRPAILPRDQKDAGVRVWHPHPPEIAYTEPECVRAMEAILMDEGALRAGTFELPLDGLELMCAFDSKEADNRIAKIKVVRGMETKRFGFTEYYRETWLCRARPGPDGDERRLQVGHIPAVAEGFYQGRGQLLRTSPIVNLLKIDSRLNDRRENLEYLGIEIDPVSGGVLSVRWSRMSLANFLLAASPVEHKGLSQVFGKLLT